MSLVPPRISSLLDAVRQTIEKQAFIPTPGGQAPMAGPAPGPTAAPAGPPGAGMPPPPMDPAAMGGMPMDPSMMGAPPMDPSMMGAPPMDPSMMGAPPMDPSMMGAPPMGPAAMGGMPMDPSMMGAPPPAGGAPAPGGAPAASVKMELPQMVQLGASIAEFLGAPLSAAAILSAGKPDAQLSYALTEIAKVLGISLPAAPAESGKSKQAAVVPPGGASGAVIVEDGSAFDPADLFSSSGQWQAVIDLLDAKARYEGKV